MTFINWTESIGIIIGTATETTTGSIVLTLGIVLILLLAAATLFGIRWEFTSIIVLPLLLSYMAYYSEFIAIGCMIFIYLALVFTKKFIFK